MNNIDDLISSISDDLKQEQCVKDYFYFKKMLENDSYFIDLGKNLKYHQKEMCKNKNNPDIYNKEKIIYKELKQEFDNYPTLINYQIAKDEVYSLLVEIKNILS